MRVSIALLGGEPLAIVLGLIEVSPMEDQLGAQGPHGCYLYRIGFLRQHDKGPGAKQSAGIGYGLAMVSGGSGNHPAAAFLLAQVGQQVDSSPGFECPQG